jgi:hypothetical protein
MTLRWKLIGSTPANWPGGIGTAAVVTGPATLEYSVDGGSNWITAGTDLGVAAAVGSSFNFELPGACLIRITGGTCRICNVQWTNDSTMYLEEVP